MTRALIVGCGYVGRALADQLVSAGAEVWALRRSKVPPGEGIRWLQGDVGDPERLAALGELEGPLDLHYLVGADGYTEEAYRSAYVDGLRHVLAALEGVEVRRLLYCSSTAVFAQSDGSWVDEDSPTEPTTFSGKILLEGEGLALSAPMPSSVVRLGGIYGPGRTRLIDRLVQGQAFAAVDEPRFRSRIHRDDAARIMALVAELEAPAAIYLGVDDDPADMRDVQAWMTDQLGVDPSSLEPAPPPRRGGHKRCANRRLHEVGMQWQHPSFRSGYGAMMAELGLVARG